LLLFATALSACSSAGGDGESDRRVSVTRREVKVGNVLSVTEETHTSEPVAAPSPDRAQPQSSNLTAGDHDDLLNPDLYAGYANRFLQQQHVPLPFIDPRRRVAVRIVDATGKPVPQARIALRGEDGGESLSLVSAADGVASIYPGFDALRGRVRVSVASDAGTTDRMIDLRGSGRQDVTLTMPGQGRAVRAMDLVLVLDTTGSMGDEMRYLQAELETIVARLKRDAGNLDLRIGLVVYRDEGDDYVSRAYPLTGDIGALRTTLAQQDADGGGDMPEAVDRALADASAMSWRPDAAKVVLLVADAPPHERAFGATLDAARRLRGDGVQIVPVAASGVEDNAQYMMRAMAVLTQGRYIFLTDDSGIGNPHAEPDVACYVVTRLDLLIARVLAGMAEGRRIEPAQSEIIRTVGDYDNGRCRPPVTAMN